MTQSRLEPSKQYDNDINVVLHLCKEILNNSHIMPSDNFFSLGGTSLKAASLVVRLNEYLHPRRISTGDVLDASSLRDIALCVSNKGKENGSSMVKQHKRQWAEGTYPASIQQQSIWFLESISPCNTAYNATTVIDLKGAFDRSKLIHALEFIIQRHTLIRSSFFTQRGELVYSPVDAVPIPLQEKFTDNMTEAQRMQLIVKLGQHQFDIRKPPLIRWLLLTLEPNHHQLIQVEHHFIHDGWSTWLLLHDLSMAYRHPTRSGEAVSSPREYSEFTIWQKHWLQTKEARAQASTWSRLVKSTSSSTLKKGAPRPPNFNFKGGCVHRKLDKELRRSIIGSAKRAETTPFVLMMAVFAQFIANVTTSNSITLGTMVRNRSQGMEKTVGMFVNTVAIPLQNLEVGINETIGQLKCRLNMAQRHEALPFKHVVANLNQRFETDRNPVFQVCFSMNDWPHRNLDFGPEVNAEVHFPSNEGAKFDLDVVLEDPASGKFLWRFYNPIFSHNEVIKLAEDYEKELFNQMSLIS